MVKCYSYKHSKQPWRVGLGLSASQDSASSSSLTNLPFSCPIWVVSFLNHLHWTPTSTLQTAHKIAQNKSHAEALEINFQNVDIFNVRGFFPHLKMQKIRVNGIFCKGKYVSFYSPCNIQWMLRQLRYSTIALVREVGMEWISILISP